MSRPDAATTRRTRWVETVRSRVTLLAGVGSGAVSGQSATIAGGLVILAFLLMGSSVTAVRFVVISLLLGAVAGVAVVMTDPTDTVGALLGGTGSLAVITLLAGLLGLTVQMSGLPAAGVVASGAVAGFGLTCFRVAVIGTGAVVRATVWITRVTIVTALLTGLVAGVTVDAASVPLLADIGVAEATLTSSNGTVTVAAGFVAVSLFGAAGVWLLTAVLPPAAAVPASRRAQYRTVRSAVRTVLSLGLVAVGFVIAVTYLLTVEAADVATPVTPVVESSVVRASIVQLGIVTIVLAGVIRVLRSTGTTLLYRQPPWIASAVVVNTVILGVGILASKLITEQAAETLPAGDAVVTPTVSVVGTTPVAIGLMGLALVAVLVVLLSLPVMTGLNLLPALTAGPRLVLFAAIGAVVASATAESHILAVATSLVAGFVAWDIAADSARRTADVGTERSINRGELAHAGWSLSVGAGAILLTTAIREVLETGTLFEEQLFTVATLAAVVTMLAAVLLWSR